MRLRSLKRSRDSSLSSPCSSGGDQRVFDTNNQVNYFLHGSPILAFRYISASTLQESFVALNSWVIRPPVMIDSALTLEIILQKVH